MGVGYGTCVLVKWKWTCWTEFIWLKIFTICAYHQIFWW